MAGGQPVLFTYEKFALAREALDAVGARPCPAGAESAWRGQAEPAPAAAARSQACERAGALPDTVRNRARGPLPGTGAGRSAQAARPAQPVEPRSLVIRGPVTGAGAPALKYGRNPANVAHHAPVMR